MTSDEKREFATHGLTRGAICGGILIIYMAISYACGAKGLEIAGLVHYCIISYSIYYCQLSWKRRMEGIQFGGLLLLGVLCGVAASVFVDLYSAVYIKMLNPGYMDTSIEQSMEIIRKANMYSEAELNQAQSLTRSMFGPMMMISTSILYAIISALLGAFSAFLINMKNKKN